MKAKKVDATTHSAHRWEELLLQGYRLMLDPMAKKLGDPDKHFTGTPGRMVKAYKDMFWGIQIDPATTLNTTFTERKYDQMIWVAEIPFVSYCRHHLLPFYGKVHFAYLPKKRIVGLSKIPRLIRVLSSRPQLQENLTEELVKTFHDVVKPLGCGALIEATHCCMFARGVHADAVTTTVALRGEFRKPHVKQEFLQRIAK